MVLGIRVEQTDWEAHFHAVIQLKTMDLTDPWKIKIDLISCKFSLCSLTFYCHTAEVYVFLPTHVCFLVFSLILPYPLDMPR